MFEVNLPLVVVTVSSRQSMGSEYIYRILFFNARGQLMLSCIKEMHGALDSGKLRPGMMRLEFTCRDLTGQPSCRPDETDLCCS